jgi:hypothetical protein
VPGRRRRVGLEQGGRVLGGDSLDPVEPRGADDSNQHGFPYDL